ncbi:MAG: CheR family methyltransferase [Pseudomonadota bacterium]
MDSDFKDIEFRAEPQMSFPIVGIGASAGGLEAVTSMFHKIEVGTGMAFVLVLHLDPNHESLMAELLSRKTHIDVRQIVDGDKIEVDCLHVIPPGSSLSIEDGHFKLEAFAEPRGLRRPIDVFFTSLAETQLHKSACVVLSGTGGDGSAGLRVIKEMDGVCAVQSPDEARYDGMPFSALSTKLVDFTLPASDIIPRLKLYFDGTFRPHFSKDTDRVLQNIFELLRSSFGHDFSGYKRSTLIRRLDRRMQVLEIPDANKYLEKLTQSIAEQETLLQDFLINVTAFFRDREQFEALRTQVIEPMILGSDGSDELRIWVPGCSSGQEAYSIAMMVDEACELYKRRPLVQIFATDIDEAMIAQARRAVYPVSVFSELPGPYQDVYTLGLDGKFELVKRIRDMVRFSSHNIVQDPPFSKIDLISCRNLLIYLGEQLQNEVLPLMHFSLRPGGHLFLGTSENVTRKGELFAAVDQRSRIFRRQDTAKRMHINLPLGSGQSESASRKSSKMAQELDFPRHRSLDSTNATIYEQYAPPFLRLSADGRIIDSSGDLSLFLASRPGDDRNLQTLARDSVRDVVMPLISDAVAEDRRRAIKDVEVHSPFGVQMADIIAHPLKDDTVAVVFLVKDRLTPVVDEYAVAPHTRDRRIADLQDDLNAARLLLKSKVEEVETANEELKSSNEEMMSMNEELQSANEELTTANEELKNKIDELMLANADLDNFVQSSDIAMVVLDRAMRIRHVTDAARKAIPLVNSDKGRLMSEFNIDFKGFDLLRAIPRVLESGKAVSKTTEVDAQGGAYFIRVMPYFFNDNTIEGVTITMVDISEETRLRNSLDLESRRLKVAMKAGRMGLAELDVDSGQITIDAVLAEQFGLGGPGIVDFDYLTRHIPEYDVERIKAALEQAMGDNKEEYEVDFVIKPPNKPERWIRTRGIPYAARDGRLKVVGPTLDITDENAIERQETLLREMSHRIKNLFAVIGALVELMPKQDDGTRVFADDLMKRIVSLGDAYDLARKNKNLSGVKLNDLIEKLVAPHLTGQTLEIKGPLVRVSDHSLNTLSLILHELTTNAVKYGALSHEIGELQVTWSIAADGMVPIRWVETVPDLKIDPSADGFGSRLINTGAMQLGGDYTRELKDGGIVCSLNLQLAEGTDG